MARFVKDVLGEAQRRGVTMLQGPYSANGPWSRNASQDRSMISLCHSRVSFSSSFLEVPLAWPELLPPIPDRHGAESANQ